MPPPTISTSPSKIRSAIAAELPSADPLSSARARQTCLRNRRQIDSAYFLGDTIGDRGVGLS
jgi:hypothetical protein